MERLISFISVIGLLLVVNFAEVPHLISYQGKLLDSSGDPITGEVTITFQLWTSETGGELVWSETHNVIPTSDGLYDVILGSLNPFDSAGVDFSVPYYLAVTVDSVELCRYQLTSSPYALNLQSFGADSGQILKWNGSKWVPAADESGTSSSGASGLPSNCSELPTLGGYLTWTQITLSSGIQVCMSSPLPENDWGVQKDVCAALGGHLATQEEYQAYYDSTSESCAEMFINAYSAYYREVSYCSEGWHNCQHTSSEYEGNSKRQARCTVILR